MKNKALFISVGFLAILLIVLIGIKENILSNFNKLKTDITYPTSNGLAFSCDSTSLAVGDEITCSLVGKYSGGITGISGLISTDDELEIVSITSDSATWKSLGEEDEIFYATENGPTSEEFIVASIRIRGLDAGSSRLVFSKLSETDGVDIIDSNYNDNYINDVVQNIVVTDDSSGESTGDGTSSVNTLDFLNLSEGEISPAFDPNINEYSIVVPYEVDEITLSGSLTDKNATINGLDTYQLEVGDNAIQLEVIAENGDSNIYELTVIREDKLDENKSSDNTLKSLSIEGVTLSPEFNPNVTEYTASVGLDVESISVDAELNNPNASIEISGTETIGDGTNIILIKVTAENNSIKTYTIVVEKNASESTDNCTLELSSSVYKINNKTLTIDGVQIDESDETIGKNITTSCGVVAVGDNKVIVASGKNMKTYKINRMFLAKTGQQIINYSLIIVSVGLIVGVLLILRKKFVK